MQNAMIAALRHLWATRAPSVHGKDWHPGAPVFDGQKVIFPECLYGRLGTEEVPIAVAEGTRRLQAFRFAAVFRNPA
jgi:hypothetical protein